MELEYIKDCCIDKMDYSIPISCVIKLKDKYSIYEILNEYYRQDKLLECIFILHYQRYDIDDYDFARNLIKNIFNRLDFMPALKQLQNNVIYIALANLIFFYWMNDQIYRPYATILVKQLYQLRYINEEHVHMAFDYLVIFIKKQSSSAENVQLIYKYYILFIPHTYIKLNDTITLFIHYRLNTTMLYTWISQVLNIQRDNKCYISIYKENLCALKCLYQYDIEAKINIESQLCLQQLREG